MTLEETNPKNLDNILKDFSQLLEISLKLIKEIKENKNINNYLLSDLIRDIIRAARETKNRAIYELSEIIPYYLGDIYRMLTNVKTTIIDSTYFFRDYYTPNYMPLLYYPVV